MVGISIKMNIRPSYAVWLGLKRVDKFTAAEIGVREGWNARELLKTSDELERLILVDNYMGENEKYEKVMLETLKPFWDRCDYRHMTSIEAAKTIEDGSLDYVYIDGNHEHNSVFADMEAWYPKVKKFGMIAGHDWWYEGVQEGVVEFARNNLLLRLFAVKNIFNGVPLTSVEWEAMDWWAFKFE